MWTGRAGCICHTSVHESTHVCAAAWLPCLAARPVRSAQATGGAVEKERSTREAVLADAQALLAVSDAKSVHLRLHDVGIG